MLGIVPAGTVNVLALELGLPFQVERACNVIAGGKTISLDQGKVNGRRFMLMMGAGIDALTVRNIDPLAKRRFKELAFVTTGVRLGFAQKHPIFIVRANGEEHLATFFVAGNSRYYAGRFGITPMADPTDGVLDLVLYTGHDRPGLAGFWLGRAERAASAQQEGHIPPRGEGRGLPAGERRARLVPDRRRAGRPVAGDRGDRAARHRGAGAVDRAGGPEAARCLRLGQAAAYFSTENICSLSLGMRRSASTTCGSNCRPRSCLISASAAATVQAGL